MNGENIKFHKLTTCDNMFETSTLPNSTIRINKWKYGWIYR